MFAKINIGNRLNSFIKSINFSSFESTLSANAQLAMLYAPYDRIVTEQWLTDKMRNHVEQHGVRQIVSGKHWGLLNNVYERRIITNEQALLEAINVPVNQLLNGKNFALMQLVINYHIDWLKSYAQVPHELEVINKTHSKLTEIAQHIIKYITESQPEHFSENELQQLLICLYVATHPRAKVDVGNICLRILLGDLIDQNADIPDIWQAVYLAELRQDLLQQARILHEQNIIITAPQQAAMLLQKIDHIADNNIARQLRDDIKKDNFLTEVTASLATEDGRKMLALIDEWLEAERKLLKTVERGFGNNGI